MCMPTRMLRLFGHTIGHVLLQIYERTGVNVMRSNWSKAQ